MARTQNKPFLVQISRSAVETAVLRVDAQSQEAAEQMVENMLDQPHRVDLEELRERGYHLVSTSCSGDDESSWEVS